MKREVFFVLLLCIFIAACSNLGVQLPASQTAEPTVVITPTSTKQPLEKISEPGYLQGCRNIYKETIVSQAMYKDIIPGKTKTAEVEHRLGKPLTIYEGRSYDYDSSMADTWEYDLFVVFFYHEITQYVLALETQSTLDELADRYGCPELINHYYYIPSEARLESDIIFSEPANVTIFAIPTIGLEYTFQGFPVGIDQSPSSILFFEPTSIEEYILWTDWQTGDIVDWQDAVR